MDGTQFDNLIKWFAATPVTRAKVLREVAAGAAALAGVTITTERSAARHRHNRHNRHHERTRTLCHCPDATAARCRTIVKSRQKAKKHLRTHPCDYKGRCRGFSGCAAPGPCQNPATCTANGQCCAGFFCGDGTCRPGGNCTVQGATCTGAVAACCTGVCNAGGSTTGPRADTANKCAQCLSGGATCTTPGTQGACCEGRTCLETGATDVCCSVASESCTLTAADSLGTCCPTSPPGLGMICQTPSGAPGAGRCCVVNANPAPGGCPAAGTNPGCCSGNCNPAAAGTPGGQFCQA
jgi:hypothetical protein